MTIERVRAVIDAATCGFDEPHEAHLYVVAEGDRPTDKACPGVPDLAHNLMPELLALWEAAADYRAVAGWPGDAESRDRLDAALAALDAKAEEVLG